MIGTIGINLDFAFLSVKTKTKTIVLLLTWQHVLSCNPRPVATDTVFLHMYLPRLQQQLMWENREKDGVKLASSPANGRAPTTGR
ncbi:hypothetical protein DM01DRAFT_1338807 [Hesseltinella vesiculosa]|uniref:Uncharacterized protein n=1 Tax=Hesseltinella vesiculosa TaxID=101127 RepID=A0A1X2G8Q1_9FUNG|nr:hypothetical protein DM01DRAFT_1338807 [Hesseltinella vesiculosa]